MRQDEAVASPLYSQLWPAGRPTAARCRGSGAVRTTRRAPAASERRGAYELLFELASGGMATLHVARRRGAVGAERIVVVKRVHRHVLAVPEVQSMFIDESRLAGLIRHPNVVRLLDVAEADGELLMVFEYVEAVSLSMLRRAAGAAGERLPIAITARVLADALAGLDAAHAATDERGAPLGLVHRDFTPQNVLVAASGTSHLIDFGVAKAASRVTRTESGMLKGKLPYMSPEQVRGGEIDRRSDVFAAGVVLHEAVTGVAPFSDDGTDPGAILLRIMLDPVAPASSLADGIPPALDTVIERALERVRDERFATARDMREALVAAVVPASHAEVAAAVTRWCGDLLAARRAKVAAAITARKCHRPPIR
jgi:serine/threonine-protein kinase